MFKLLIREIIARSGINISQSPSTKITVGSIIKAISPEFYRTRTQEMEKWKQAEIVPVCSSSTIITTKGIDSTKYLGLGNFYNCVGVYIKYLDKKDNSKVEHLVHFNTVQNSGEELQKILDITASESKDEINITTVVNHTCSSNQALKLSPTFILSMAAREHVHDKLTEFSTKSKDKVINLNEKFISSTSFIMQDGTAKQPTFSMRAFEYIKEKGI